MNTTSKQSNGVYNIQVTFQQAMHIWQLLLKDKSEWIKFEEKFFLERGRPCFPILDALDDIDHLLAIFNLSEEE